MLGCRYQSINLGCNLMQTNLMGIASVSAVHIKFALPLIELCQM